MKKIVCLLTVFILCLGLTACEFDFSNTVKTKEKVDSGVSLLTSQKEELYNGCVSSNSTQDNSYGIGRGINALNDTYIEVTNRHNSIFDSQKLINLNWVKTKLKQQNAEVISEISAKDFQLQLSIGYSNKLSVDAGVNGLFTAGLDKDFSISNELEISKNTKEIVTKLYQNINGFSVEIEGYNDYRNFYNVLSDEFLNDLILIRNNSLSVNDFISFYGTHVVLAAYYGGRVECNYHLMFEDDKISNSTMLQYKSNAKAALMDAQYKASVSEEKSFNIKNRISNNITSTLESFTFKTHGGKYFPGSSIDDFMKNYSIWVDSFNNDEEANSVFIDVPDKALMPIWLLIPNEYSDVALKIKNTFLSLADGCYNEWLNKCVKDSDNTTDYAAGNGTKENPYLILNETHFKNISKNYDNGSYFKIINDIDLSNNNWIPFETNQCSPKQNASKLTDLLTLKAFNGYIDGNNRCITYEIDIDNALTTDNNHDYGFGLFGYVNGATFINLNINGKIYCSNKTKGYANVMGLFAGWAINSKFENCTTSGSVQLIHLSINDDACVRSGGFVGVAKECSFKACVNSADVLASSKHATAGGIAGGNSNSYFDVTCKNSGKIKSSHGDWLFGGDNHGEIYGKV